VKRPHQLGFLAAVAAVNSGCFVITSNHVSKPVAPAENVELRHDQNGSDSTGWYVGHFHSTNLDFDLSVYNNAERFQTGFLFWVIPIPFSKTSVPYAEIQADLRPGENGVFIDPWRIEFIPTNGIPVAPVKIWRADANAWKLIAHGQLSLNKSASFRLEYNAPMDPDLPFNLSVGGISIPGQSNAVTTVEYQRAKIIRSGLKLPY
jgi:hypothetical protein